MILKDLYKKSFLFLNDLAVSNKIFTHMTFDEKNELFVLSKKTEGIFVEIGSYLGASSCFIAQGIRKSRTISKFYCIDTWQNDAMSEGKRDTYEEFLKNTEKYKDIIIPVRETSQNAVEVLKRKLETVDMLFIDADHEYPGCKRDWDFYSPFLKSGSLVIFHDYGWAEGVQRVVNDDVKPKVIKEGFLQNMWWGWIK